jgi:elongation factor G
VQRRPIISRTICPQNDADWPRLQQALSEIGGQDGSTIVCGADEQDLDSICNRIVHQYGIALDLGEPTVIYLETIRKTAEAEAKYIRQTGGSGNYGHVKLRIEPNESGKGFEFTNDIKGGVIPQEYIEPIELGIREALRGGVIAGYEIVDVKVTLFDGSYHDVDSNEMAFKIAGAIAFKEAARKANPVVLEPVMNLKVTVREEFMGMMIHDLNGRRGRIEGLAHEGPSVSIRAIVPLSEILRASMPEWPEYSVQFSGYEVARRRGGSGGDDPGVTVNRPNRPTGRSGSAALDLEADSQG